MEARARSRERIDVHALFDAAVGQQLQGPPCAGAPRHSITAWSRSTSCKARAARRNSSPRIRTGKSRCSKSRPDRYIAESNAILWYVAGGTPLAPEDRIARAEALQWMFFEQHSLEPNIGAAYFWLALIKGGRDLQRHALDDWMENGYHALGVMEAHLARQPLLRRRPLHHRRHRALRLHPCRRAVRLRPRALSGDPRLARARRRRARPRADGLAAGRAGGGADSAPRAAFTLP